MAKSKNGVRVIKVVFRVMGTIFLVAGAIMSFFTYDFMSNALPVSGRVTSVEVITGDDSVTYKPTIRYADSEGRKQTGTTFIASSSYNFSIGTNVDILYDTREPSSLRMDTWLATWGFGLILLCGAVIPFVIASVIGGRSARKTKATPKRKPRRARAVTQVEEDMIEIPARTKGLVARESVSDHEHETNYIPTVRRNR